MKYLRHINESKMKNIFKDLINWRILDDAKDMSLDSLDVDTRRILLIEIKYELDNLYYRNLKFLIIFISLSYI
jgi:hypothetical protein